MAEQVSITKTYDAFPRITEYNKSKIPSPISTSPKDAKKKDDANPMASPVIKELIHVF